jgi:hypothetical protein
MHEVELKANIYVVSSTETGMSSIQQQYTLANFCKIKKNIELPILFK